MSNRHHRKVLSSLLLALLCASCEPVYSPKYAPGTIKYYSGGVEIYSGTYISSIQPYGNMTKFTDFQLHTVHITGECIARSYKTTLE